LVALTADFSGLILLAPNVGQPTQILRGSISGGVPPYIVRVHVQRPSGVVDDYAVTGAAFILDAASSGDAFLGTQEEGTWTAWVTVIDTVGDASNGPSVTWVVAWYPVHDDP